MPNLSPGFNHPGAQFLPCTVVDEALMLSISAARNEPTMLMMGIPGFLGLITQESGCSNGNASG